MPTGVIQGPADLRGLSLESLQGVAEEIRQAIVTTCLRNGGHLGASLGTVELAIALHFAFESPEEPIVWDVGHQAYAHKLLTGRWKRFGTLRQAGGISGFLSRDESEHDAFGAGHSSTSLSAALALAYARVGTEKWTVAVTGDGAFSAGVALEALNNFGSHPTGPMLVVLNDNQMSISANVGTLSRVFGAESAMHFFELFGFEYAGPIDGHNLGELIGALQGLKANPPGRPVLLHVLTQKGKGYAPAEESPAVFHGVSAVVEKVGGATKAPPQVTYSEAFGEALCKLAEQDPKIVAITAAMPEGTGLSAFARRFPERFFDVGIAEPHAVTFAAGLATQGYRPVVAIYSTFLQRALDAIIHDVALQGLGVTLAIDRAGLVGADGPTHHGMFDLAYLGMVPGMTISAPACIEDLASELAEATRSGLPWAIRYPRGGGVQSLASAHGATNGDLPAIPVGIRWLRRARQPQAIAVGLGPAALRLRSAADRIDPAGERVSVIAVMRAKPIEAALIRQLEASDGHALLIAEDGVLRGGFGQALSAQLRSPRRARTLLKGYADEFVGHGAPAALEEGAGMSVSALAVALQELLDEKAN